jgi:hypothetical protein
MRDQFFTRRRGSKEAKNDDFWAHDGGNGNLAMSGTVSFLLLMRVFTSTICKDWHVSNEC